MSHPERIVPDETEPGIVALHLKRYDFALPFCGGKDVLDAGCGVGYGTAHLAQAARRVVGVDRDPETIEYARRRYGSERIEFLQADLLELPLQSDSFDAVCSFETIEHVPDPEALVAQLRRVTRPGGVCLVSTPRVDETTRNPENPFHSVELSAADLERLLRAHFGEVTLYGQRRLQSARHRTMQRLDPLGLRKRLTFLRPASRLLGTPPMAEVSLAEIEITRNGVEGANEIVAVCR
ncbi:MAG: class I SAM-dependent methyltransferase [Thermoleophilia bacterium]